MIRKFFLWSKTKLTRLEVYDYDLKKPDIPAASGPVQRLKAAVEKAHAQKRNIINRWKRKP